MAEKAARGAVWGCQYIYIYICICKRSAQPTSTSSPEDKETYGALPMKWLCDFELALGQLLLIHLTGGGWTANCHNARIACHRVPFKCNQATAYSLNKKTQANHETARFQVRDF